MSSNLGIGGSIGARIARHVADASVHAKAGMTPHMRSLGALVIDDFFRLTGSEVKATQSDLYAMLADHADSPEWVAKFFGFLARGEGQWQTFAAGSITGAAMGGGLLNLITNELNPVTTALVATNPNGILSPSDAARAEALGLDTGVNYRREAAGSGINAVKFNTLRELQRSWPPLAETLDALNRGVISEGHARIWMLRNGIHPDAHDFLLRLRHVELSPDRLAQLVTFGVLTQNEATPIAARGGLTAHDFDLLVQGNGAPPPPEMLAMALRRGVIDAARFRRGLIQGPLRNEWVDLVEKMTRAPMSVADAIEAVVKGHLDDAQGARIAQENGLIPEHWPILRATAGSPPGIQEMLGWRNRDIITTAQLVQGLRESRLNNKWIPFVMEAGEVLPEMATIRSMFTHRVIDRTRAIDLLRKRGFALDTANNLLDAARSVTATKTRDLTVSEVVRLYTDRRIERDAAKDMLTALGYDDTEAELRLDLGDIAREERFINGVITRVHSSYVKYLIGEGEVQDTLLRIGLTAGAVTDLLNLWGLERATVSRTLTEAQVIAALRLELIDEAEAVNRHLGMGYSEVDARILIDTALKRRGGSNA